MSGGDEAMRELYNARVMELANDIPLQRRLPAPDATVERRSPLCGSRITVDITVQDGRVMDYGHVVRACTLGQAAASIMARRVVGTETGRLRRTADAVRALLKDGAPLPDGLWDELAYLAPAHGYKSRHGSVLLAFEAVEQAIDEIERGKEAAVG